MMGKKNKEFIHITDEIVSRLKFEGFVVQRYDAHSTDSIYLKPDYGVSHSIRISDHSGKKYLKYTYNVIKDYVGKTFIKEGYLWRQYYSFSQIDKFVANIVKNRAWIKEKYHPDYEARMEECRLENEGTRGFWSKAVIV